MNEVKSVLIVGVGGQGTLLASRLLGNAMLRAGYDVKVSEVHGMSQRGGSVVTYRILVFSSKKGTFGANFKQDFNMKITRQHATVVRKKNRNT